MWKKLKDYTRPDWQLWWHLESVSEITPVCKYTTLPSRWVTAKETKLQCLQGCHDTLWLWCYTYLDTQPMIRIIYFSWSQPRRWPSGDLWSGALHTLCYYLLINNCGLFVCVDIVSWLSCMQLVTFSKYGYHILSYHCCEKCIMILIMHLKSSIHYDKD